MLAEKTESDVRACLNTLQFLSKQHAKIRVKDVARLSIGQKDMTKDVFTIWNRLLSSKVNHQSNLTKFPQNFQTETQKLLSSPLTAKIKDHCFYEMIA